MSAPDPHARFVTGPLGGHVIEMILTGWASMLAVFAVEFLSLLYLGTLKGEAVMGAVGFGSMTQFTITSICIGVTVGGAALVSRALGAGDLPRARRLAGASLILMAAAAVASGGRCSCSRSGPSPTRSGWPRTCAAICCRTCSSPRPSPW